MVRVLGIFIAIFINAYLFAKEHTVILLQADDNGVLSENNSTKKAAIPPPKNEADPSLKKNEEKKIDEKNSLYDPQELNRELNRREETFKFYSKFFEDNYKPLWFTEDKRFTVNALWIIKAIKESETHGLNPEKYHKSKIFSLTKKLIDKEYANEKERNFITKELDILFTDAYISLAYDMYYGFGNWREIVKISETKKEKFEWLRENKNINLIDYLAKRFIKKEVKKAIDDLAPPYKEYENLKKALSFYKKIAENGGFEKIPFGKTIRYGSKDPRLIVIRKRLGLDINQTEDPAYYDKKLLKEVKNFQKRFSLFPDGSIGYKTIKAMNIPVEEIIDKIVLNMERYRWLPKDITKPYIEINIPSFEMIFKKENGSIMKMPVIVGKKERPTPVFTSYISSIVLNPYWHVPKTIVQKDLLKKIKTNPESFYQKNMHVYDNWKLENEINIYDVDWNQFTEEDNIPFVFVQEPGIYNPLGKVKFQFSNPFAVFMHDTPNKSLFNKRKRMFSSGCIRLKKPMKLLKYIVEKINGMNFLKIKDIIDSKEHYVINLKKKIPIVIDYITAKADENGKIRLYEDIYGYDKIQLTVLKSDFPSKIKFASK